MGERETEGERPGDATVRTLGSWPSRRIRYPQINKVAIPMCSLSTFLLKKATYPDALALPVDSRGCFQRIGTSPSRSYLSRDTDVRAPRL